MVHIAGEIIIGRPVEQVFDFVADERNEPRYNAQMRRADKISEGPIGLGTQYRAEVVSGRQVVPMVIECTGFERPRMLASMTRMSSMDVRYAPDLRSGVAGDPDAVGRRCGAEGVPQGHDTGGGLDGPAPGAADLDRPETLPRRSRRSGRRRTQLRHRPRIGSTLPGPSGRRAGHRSR